MKKKLSKEVYGTSPIISLAETDYIFEEDMDQLVVGAGPNGMVTLSREAFAYFQEKKVRVDLSLTPEAIRRWNKAGGAAVGLFHVTC